MSNRLSSRAIPVNQLGKNGKKYCIFYPSFHVFSNFYYLDGLHYAGRIFSSSEQLYFYMKALYFNDEVTAQKILETKTPAEAKSFSTKIHGLVPAEWNKVSIEFMTKANLLKYTQFPLLGEGLLQTEDAMIVEASPSDKFWGVGLSWHDVEAADPAKWKGKNQLGEVLMRVREILRSLAAK